MQNIRTDKLNNYFSQLAESDEALVLATVIQSISPTSANPGDKALVSANSIVEGWIGGGCAQPAVIEAADKALSKNEPMVIRIAPEGEWQTLDGVTEFTSKCLSGGTLVIFIEPLSKPLTLSILGHSPVALSLGLQASTLGFSVKIASPDLDTEQVSEGISCAVDFADVDADFVVIATQGKHDRAAINAALNCSCGNISMVASKKKMAGLKRLLRDDGVEPQDLDRIQGPAGVDIGAETPAEIALSVLAELVRDRRSNKVKTRTSNTADRSTLDPVKAQADRKIVKGGCCGG